ncbi:MAG: DUF2723 domain-containing protein [Candidatus Coatesbacteria bacterium]
MIPRRLVPAAAFLIVWQAGLLTLAPGAPHGDSGETAGVALHLGIAHPPGYPLPTLLGHLAARWIPAGSVAWRVSLLSLAAASTAAAAGTIALFRLAPGLPAWLVLALGVAGGLPLEVWNQMTLPKGSVYTVTIALLAGLAALLSSQDATPGRRGAAGGLTAGLAACGHYYMLVPFAPFLLAEFVRSIRGRPGAARAGALAACGVVLGASLYLYLPLRTTAAHPSFRWAEPVTWGRFQWLVLRRQYVSIEKQGRGNGGLLLAGRFADRFRAGFGWPGVLLVPVALGLAWRRRAWWLMAVAAGGVGEIAAAAFYPKLEPDALWVADPFFSAGWWAAGLLLAGGLALLAEQPGRWLRGVVVAAALALAVQSAVGGFNRVSKRWNYYASDFMANLADTIPRNAILFAEGDAYIAPLLQGLFVDDLRPDVRLIIPIFLHFDWGLAQIQMQYPDLRMKSLKPWGHIWIEAKDIMEANPGRPWCYTLTTSTGWPFGKWAVNEGLVYQLWVHDKPSMAHEDAADRRNLRWRLRGVFSAAAKRDPFDRVQRDNYIQGYFGRGIWRHTRREEALAMRLFERARRLGSPEAALNAGLVYYGLGDLGRAERCWREARDGAPDRPEAWVNLGLLALRRMPPQADEAIQLAEAGLARDRKFARAYEVLANAWYLKGDVPQAVTRLREAIALEPGNPMLKRMLAAMLKRAGVSTAR